MAAAGGDIGLRAGRVSMSVRSARPLGARSACRPQPRHAGSRQLRSFEREAGRSLRKPASARLCLHGRNLEERGSCRDAHQEEGGTLEFSGSNARTVFGSAPKGSGRMQRAGRGRVAGCGHKPPQGRPARQCESPRAWPLCAVAPRRTCARETTGPRRTRAHRQHAQFEQGVGGATRGRNAGGPCV